MTERDSSVPGVMSAWQRWVHRPQNTSLYRIFFQIHFLVGAVIGIYVYFAFPQLFNAFFHYIDPQDKFSDPLLAALSDLHFGRFNLITKAVWSVIGLVPAVLSGTGVFVCCRRIMFNKDSNPHHGDAG